MKNFSSNLKDLRNEKGFTQDTTAKLAGVEYGPYCKWEQGKSRPSYEDLIKLANFFQVSIDYLLGNSDDLGNVTIITSFENTLSKNERTLLTQFKKLSASEKDLILKQINSWTENK